MFVGNKIDGSGPNLNQRNTEPPVSPIFNSGEYGTEIEPVPSNDK